MIRLNHEPAIWIDVRVRLGEVEAMTQQPSNNSCGANEAVICYTTRPFSTNDIKFKPIKHSHFLNSILVPHFHLRIK
jgi:hypothetical protein